MSMTSEIKLTIAITDSSFASCLERPALLGQELSTAHEEAINAFVFDQLTDKDGAPQLTDFEVKSLIYNRETSKGRFRLAFRINRRFCCADVESCAADYLDFDFTFREQAMHAKASYFAWSLDN